MKKHKLLLIDDDPLFLMLTKRVLKDSPYIAQLDTVESVPAAQAYLKSCSDNGQPFPEIIFVDIEMPMVGGLEFATDFSSSFYRQHPQTKLVMLSSSISQKDREKAFEIEAVAGFIEKPLTKSKLQQLLGLQSA